MKRSAASSSSAVVTPGWHLALSMRRHRAWIAPAAAIPSICSGVFLMIIARPSACDGLQRLELFLHPQDGKHRADAGIDLGGLARSVDPPQDRPVLVIGDQRLGLLVVGLEAPANHL